MEYQQKFKYFHGYNILRWFVF